MSTTTQILFNSPALHSLKRDQLVKLCKTHSIKANGKNVELVERLKSHAKTLPNDNPLSVAIRSEQENEPLPADDAECDEESTLEKAFNPRPSSQWEVVMDSIMEESEDSSSSQGGSSQGTLSSLKSNFTLAGEFGTGSVGSKSTLTVSSSIRALATSLGLKRHATSATAETTSSRASSKLLSSFPLPPASDDLSKHSIPYDALPPPSLTDLQTDHFTFDTTDPATVAANLNPNLGTAPLPGHTLRPGVPAPVNARLSLGLAPRTPSKQGPSTTIRLVSFGNSVNTATAASSINNSMPPVGDTPNLKPFKTTFDLDLGSPTTPLVAFPASIYPALPASPPVDDTERRMSIEASTSMHGLAPAVDVDDDAPMPGAFDAPATPSPSKIPKPAFVFGSPSPGPATFSFAMPASPSTTDAANKARVAAQVMEEMNRRVFGEGGVPPTPPARVIRPLPGSASKSGNNKAAGRFDKAHDQMFGRMESIADAAARKEGLKRKSSAVSMRPGAATAAEEDGPRQGKRVRVDDAGGDGKANVPAAAEAEAKQKEREKEAVRRKLELSRARRRSSAAAGGRRVSGRVSGAGVLGKFFSFHGHLRVTDDLLVKPKPSASRGRFGFFAGAAKLVQGVWGGGKKAAAPAPKAPAASTSKTEPVKPAGKANVAKTGSMGPPPAPSANNAANQSLRPPSLRSVVSARSTAAGRARSPLPSSFAPSATASSKSTASSVRTRNSSIAGASSVGTRTSSAAGSMGTRSSLRVGSLGTRGSISSSASKSSTPSSTVDSQRKTGTGGRPSSRLLAPTASSLAKMNGSPSPGALAAVQEKQQDGSSATDVVATTPAAASSTTGTARGKGKLLPARKPRISRSRVIAKLASQRVASGSSIASAASVASSRKSFGGGRTRSSLGAKAQRGSFAGMKNAGGPSGGMGVVLDAKKRARQSEYYARRKSRASQPGRLADVGEAMQVDS
ncbi:SAP domain-containing protein [Favolaschia claudopus]|uniref:SAP domain-containing protein n=1 Tax=Favolaschia claudopus TaxID=2862362 RepID=A0AAW0A5Z1_9AGAR